MKDYLAKMTNGISIPIGTYFCVGQNYAKHIAEMGAKPKSEPLIFIKPAQATVFNNDTIELPKFSNNIHYEVELIILIGQDCYNIEIEDAKNYIAGYGIGIDITARDIQKKAKDDGGPWALAKGFRQSAPISNFIPANEISDNSNFDLKLWIDGELKQSGNTKDMERSIEQIISYLSKTFSLRKGDIIYTGTPEGVGQIKTNNRIVAKLDNSLELNINIK